MDETIAQAQAAAARAATILSRGQLEIMGRIAFVNPADCVACATCVRTCPYGAPMINVLRKAEVQSTKCVGCGSCAAACPSRTITLQHQESETVVAMLEELLTGGAA
jgi:heterodisulfide reductase subunit A-like polyferredoxin